MVACLTNAVLNLWYLGFPDQALAQSYKAIKLAKESSHVYDLAYALYCSSWSHQLRREAQATQAQAEAAIELSTRHGFAYWLATATILRGWALVEQGQTEAGLADLRQGLADVQTIGAMLLRPYFLALLSEAYEKIGQVDKGLVLLSEVLTTVDRTKERHYEAELYRLKGQLLLQMNAKVEAEHHFRQAMRIAQNQQAKSLELRAVMSLSRLWQSQGKGVYARQVLAEIYEWFSEGFETTDLKAARTLLKELA
jgi:predicted ATPase